MKRHKCSGLRKTIFVLLITYICSERALFACRPLSHRILVPLFFFFSFIFASHNSLCIRARSLIFSFNDISLRTTSRCTIRSLALWRNHSNQTWRNQWKSENRHTTITKHIKYSKCAYGIECKSIFFGFYWNFILPEINKLLYIKFSLIYLKFNELT